MSIHGYSLILILPAREILVRTWFFYNQSTQIVSWMETSRIWLSAETSILDVSTQATALLTETGSHDGLGPLCPAYTGTVESNEHQVNCGAAGPYH